MPLVSVIIPVHNRRNLLERAIQSVMNQSFTDYEMIVVDDASTEELRYPDPISSDKRVVFYRLENHCGVSCARNLGVKKSEGKWIAFLDSDDQWHKNKLRAQIDWFNKNPGFSIMQSREIWIRNGQRVNPPKTHEKFQGDLFESSLDRCMITPSSVILSRSLFDEFRGFNESFPACEDYDLWLRITSRYPVGLIEKDLLMRYGGHEDQLSASVPILDRFRIRSILQLIENFSLEPKQYSTAVATLVKKADIVANGYKKRNNMELYERYSTISRRFLQFQH